MLSMLQPTDEEIMAGLNSIFSDGFFDRREINIERIDDDRMRIVVSRQYKHYPLTFDVMKRLSELLRTDHLDFDNEYSPGCDTCDYGSSCSIIVAARWDRS